MCVCVCINVCVCARAHLKQFWQAKSRDAGRDRIYSGRLKGVTGDDRDLQLQKKRNSQQVGGIEPKHISFIKALCS